MQRRYEVKGSVCTKKLISKKGSRQVYEQLAQHGGSTVPPCFSCPGGDDDPNYETLVQAWAENHEVSWSEVRRRSRSRSQACRSGSASSRAKATRDAGWGPPKQLQQRAQLHYMLEPMQLQHPMQPQMDEMIRRLTNLERMLEDLQYYIRR